MNRRAFLKAVGAGACLGAVRCVSAAGGPSVGKPNIVLCMADDQGWGDMAYNGHPVLETPSFDAMAAAPSCSGFESWVTSRRSTGTMKARKATGKTMTFARPQP